MYIILSQKKDFKSSYKDELFKLYHFPAKYYSQIHVGDRFIYNQGKQGITVSNGIRYYYGTGVIESIYSEDNGKTYFAKLSSCKMFYNNVPIKFDDGSYIEQLGFEKTRSKPNWQSSIRKLSFEAYDTIIKMSGGLIDVQDSIDIEVLKVNLKSYIDEFYLHNNHQALIDMAATSLLLMQKYGNITQ